jgi:hypothetical protein
MMTVKNRPGQIVKIPPTLPTLLLPSPLPSVTIRPDLQRTAIRALHPLLPSDLPQVSQAILPRWEKNLSDGFTIHGSPSPSDSLSPHYPPNLRSLEGMSLLKKRFGYEEKPSVRHLPSIIETSLVFYADQLRIYADKLFTK